MYSFFAVMMAIAFGMKRAVFSLVMHRMWLRFGFRGDTDEKISNTGVKPQGIKKKKTNKRGAAEESNAGNIKQSTLEEIAATMTKDELCQTCGRSRYEHI